MRHSILRDGLIAGVLGATSVAVWFFFVDLFFGQALATPFMLGRGLISILGITPTNKLLVVGTYTVFHYAAFFGSPETVVALVAAEADLEARSTNEEFAPEATPLHSAVAAGRMDNAEALLEAGADPNARQRGGFTPLMEAEQRGDLDLAEMLIRYGAHAGGGA